MDETKILPSPIFSVFGRVADRGDRRVDLVVGQNHLDFHLGKEVHHVFGAAVKLGMTFLAAKSLDLDHAQALNADVLQGLFYFVQLEGLDDGFDLFSWFRLLGVTPVFRRV